MPCSGIPGSSSRPILRKQETIELCAQGKLYNVTTSPRCWFCDPSPSNGKKGFCFGGRNNMKDDLLFLAVLVARKNDTFNSKPINL